jgi:hypothetical protein
MRHVAMVLKGLLASVLVPNVQQGTNDGQMEDARNRNSNTCAHFFFVP